MSSPIKNSAKHQYLVTISVNLLIIGYGTSCGWPSVSFATLESAEMSPLHSGPLRTEEISWLVSLFCLGGICGTTIFGLTINMIGRKTFLCLLAIPQIISWVLILLAKDVIYLFISRLLVGIAGGGAYIFVPLFVAEISEDRVRGTLGTIMMISCNVGILFAFIAGDLISYATFPLYLMAMPIIFLLVFISFPESPIYLMQMNRTEEAYNSLKFYRNVRRISQINSEYFQRELLKLQCTSQLNNKKEKTSETQLSLADFKIRPARKAFMIAIALFTITGLSGCFILISYSAAIFAESGSSIPSNWSAVIVAFIQLTGTYVSSILVDRIGRKPLLIFSSFGGGLSLAGFSTYTYFGKLDYDLQAFDWIPVTTFSSLVFMASCGVLPLSYVVLTEIMPTKIKGIGTSICLSYSWLLTFLLLKYFPIVRDLLGLHICLAFFGICSLMGTLFVIFVIPETKGKSFEEIQQMLDK